jgi:pyrroloquinoline quinone biosynthesis protein E
MGTFNITYTGGEILIHPDIIKIIETTDKLGFRWSLFTNGYKLNKTIINILKKSKNLKAVHLSLYAVTPETHDKITTVKGSHNKTVNSILMLKKNGIDTVLKSPVMTINYNEIDNLIKFADDNRLTHFFEFTLFPKENFDRTPLKYMLNKTQLKNVTLKMYKLNKIKDLFKKDKNRDKFLNSEVCVAGKNKIVISYNGNIYPCVTLRKSAGNIFNDKLEKVWYNSKWLEEFRKVKNKDISGCNNCVELLNYCKYKCPGVSYLYYKNIYKAPKVRCLLAQINKEVIENEKL